MREERSKLCSFSSVISLGAQLDNSVSPAHGSDWLVFSARASHWASCFLNWETAASCHMPDKSVNSLEWTDSKVCTQSARLQRTDSKLPRSCCYGDLQLISDVVLQYKWLVKCGGAGPLEASGGITTGFPGKQRNSFTLVCWYEEEKTDKSSKQTGFISGLKTRLRRVPHSWNVSSPLSYAFLVDFDVKGRCTLQSPIC